MVKHIINKKVQKKLNLMEKPMTLTILRRSKLTPEIWSKYLLVSYVC